MYTVESVSLKTKPNLTGCVNYPLDVSLEWGDLTYSMMTISSRILNKSTIGNVDIVLIPERIQFGIYCNAKIVVAAIFHWTSLCEPYHHWQNDVLKDLLVEFFLTLLDPIKLGSLICPSFHPSVFDKFLREPNYYFFNVSHDVSGHLSNYWPCYFFHKI